MWLNRAQNWSLLQSTSDTAYYWGPRYEDGTALLHTSVSMTEHSSESGTRHTSVSTVPQATEELVSQVVEGTWRQTCSKTFSHFVSDTGMQICFSSCLHCSLLTAFGLRLQSLLTTEKQSCRGRDVHSTLSPGSHTLVSSVRQSCTSLSKTSLFTVETGISRQILRSFGTHWNSRLLSQIWSSTLLHCCLGTSLHTSVTTGAHTSRFTWWWKVSHDIEQVFFQGILTGRQSSSGAP